MNEVKIKYIYETDSDLAMSFDAQDVEKNPIRVSCKNMTENSWLNLINSRANFS